MALPGASWMLDEPSLGVAPLFVKTIFEALAALNRDGMTILVVEQNLKPTLYMPSAVIASSAGAVVIEDRARW